MIRDLNMPFGGMKASGTGRESAQVRLGRKADSCVAQAYPLYEAG